MENSNKVVELITPAEAALIECFDAAIPQASPWTGTAKQKAGYAAKVLSFHIKGLNCLLETKSLDAQRYRKLKALTKSRAVDLYSLIVRNENDLDTAVDALPEPK